ADVGPVVGHPLAVDVDPGLVLEVGIDVELDGQGVGDSLGRQAAAAAADCGRAGGLHHEGDAVRPAAAAFGDVPVEGGGPVPVEVERLLDEGGARLAVDVVGQAQGLGVVVDGSGQGDERGGAAE